MDASVAAKQPQWLEKPVRISEQKWPEGTKPVVSIFCITYNHEKFIRDAIEGFLMQETTFPVEIFIHDDASTDHTADIIKEYAEKYPSLFWTVLQDENQYSKNGTRFFFQYLSKQRGEFIAICEGDDYWIKSDKLQQQVEFLQKNAAASGCFHVAEVRNSTGSSITVTPPMHLQRDRVLEDIWFNFWLPTCSLVCRREMVPLETAWASHLPMGDAPLFGELCSGGPIKILPIKMAVYRQHDGGVWTSKSLSKKTEGMLSLQLALRQRFGSHKFPLLNRSIKNLYASLFGAYVLEGRKREATRYLLKYLTCTPLCGDLCGSQRRNLVKYFLPLRLFKGI